LPTNNSILNYFGREVYPPKRNKGGSPVLPANNSILNYFGREVHPPKRNKGGSPVLPTNNSINGLVEPFIVFKFDRFTFWQNL
jgi:hypothetical protein